jgi:hypothetical protein
LPARYAERFLRRRVSNLAAAHLVGVVFVFVMALNTLLLDVHWANLYSDHHQTASVSLGGVDLHGRSHEWFEFHLHEEISLLLRRSLVLCPAHRGPNDQTAAPHRAAEVDRRGDLGMGFSHDMSGHHFHLLSDGGAIEVESNSPDDDTSKAAIRRLNPQPNKRKTRVLSSTAAPENGLHPPLCIRIQVPHHGEYLAAELRALDAPGANLKLMPLARRSMPRFNERAIDSHYHSLSRFGDNTGVIDFPADLFFNAFTDSERSETQSSLNKSACLFKSSNSRSS